MSLENILNELGPAFEKNAPLFDKENSMDFKFRIDKVITVNNTYNNQLNYLNSSYSKGILLVMKDKKDK